MEQPTTTNADPAETREQFAARKLADLPPEYRDRLGGDPAKWDAEARRLTLQYRADKGWAGPTELIALGLADSRPPTRVMAPMTAPGGPPPKPAA